MHKKAKKSFKEKCLYHHKTFGKYHKETTEAVFMLGLLVVSFFAFVHSLPTLTGFAVASGEAVVSTASTTAAVISTINNSEERLYFKLFSYIMWVFLFGLISVAVIDYKRKKGTLYHHN